MHPVFRVFALLNALLGAYSLLSAFVTGIFLVAVWMDPKDLSQAELVAGSTVYGLMAIGQLILVVIYTLAAVGLWRQTFWGLYAHYTATGITLLNPACCCVGLVYSLPAFIIPLQQDVHQAVHPVSLETIPPNTGV